jgi:hypothetical protein
MKVIDIQTSFIESLDKQATMTIIQADDHYKVTLKVGDEEKSSTWKTLSLCYDWAVGRMMYKYGVGV